MVCIKEKEVTLRNFCECFGTYYEIMPIQRHFFLSLFIVLVLPNVYCANDENLVRQITVHNQGNEERVLYYYNDNRDKVLELTQLRESEVDWQNKTCVEWLYNDAGKCVTQYFKEWKDEAWQTEREIQCSYQNDTLMHEQVCYVFPDANTRRGSEKWNFMYNEEGLLIQKDYSVDVNNVWMKQTQTTFSYHSTTQKMLEMRCQVLGEEARLFKVDFCYADSAGSQSQSQIVANYEDETWVNAERFTWYYLPDGVNVNFVKQEKWEQTQWINVQKVCYKYDHSHQLTAEIYQHWACDFWQYDLRYDYCYDTNGRLETKVTQFPIYNAWRDVSTLYYQYDENPQKQTVSSRFDFWGGDNDSFAVGYIPFVFNKIDNVETIVGDEIEILYNEVPASIPNSSFGAEQLVVYPNPSNGVFYINAQDVSSWSLSTLSGMLIERQVRLYNSGMIDITQQAAGVYLLRIETQNETYVKRIIKQ